MSPYAIAMAEAHTAYIQAAHANATGCARTAIRTYAESSAWMLEQRPENYGTRIAVASGAVAEIVSCYWVNTPELCLPAV